MGNPNKKGHGRMSFTVKIFVKNSKKDHVNSWWRHMAIHMYSTLIPFKRKKNIIKTYVDYLKLQEKNGKKIK